MRVIESTSNHRNHLAAAVSESPSTTIEFRPRRAAESRETGPVVRSPGAWILIAFLRFYILFLSPVFGGACKFYPSCSNYAVEAVSKHGARRGLVLAAKRLLRCRPFTQGGFDPVPDDLPHSKQPKLVEANVRVLKESESNIQRTERRLL
jgi:uncharacterized protein